MRPSPTKKSSNAFDGILSYSLEHRAGSEVIARHLGRVAVVPDGPILAGGLTELLARVIREGIRLGFVHTSDPVRWRHIS